MEIKNKYSDGESRFIDFSQENFGIETREVNGQNVDYIVGYGVVFNSDSQVLYDFVERIAPTAADGLDMSKVIATINHDFSKVLARADSNTLTLSVDQRGIKYEFPLPNTTYAQDLKENIRIGNIKGSSFIFSTQKDRWTHYDDPLKPSLREVIKFRAIYEMGPVTSPAYLDTTVAQRSLEAARKPEYDFKTTQQRIKILKLKTNGK